MTRQITLVCHLFALAAVTCGRVWTSTDLPSPQNDPTGACARGALRSSVCNPDAYLSQSDADAIDGLINFVYEGSHGFQRLPCRGAERGVQIAVAVVEAMPRSSASKEARAFQFAKTLHDRWRVGDPDCQNGVVLFLAIHDRAIGISIGAGIRSIFTDALVPKVMAVMRRRLKKEEYGQGIIDGVVAIGNILSTGKPPKVPDNDNWFGFGFVALVLGVIGISLIVRRRKNRRYAKCKNLLEKIDKERTAANRKEYVATSCPICLEDFHQSDQAEVPDGTETVGRRERFETGLNRASQTGSTTSATTTTAAEHGDNAANTLPCGHKFHESCILSWISGMGAGNQLCPVCRQPITEDGVERVTEMTNNGEPSGWDVYGQEYSFRVRRARYFYPDFITWNMINHWDTNRHSRSCPMATGAAFAAVDPVVVAAARSSGSRGSSFSFGGGSSRRGGGGGGGW